MNAEVILISLALIATGIVSIMADRFFKEHNQILKRLDDIEEQLGRKCHTYPTANGLEDAMAVAIDLLIRHEAEDAYRAARMERLRAILGEIREGPHAYKDKPNDRENP